MSRIDYWFLQQMQKMVLFAKKLSAQPLTHNLLEEAKKQGFSDEEIARFDGSKDATNSRKKASLQSSSSC